MALRRLAAILIWGGYGLVATIALALRLVSSSRRLDIGEVMGSVILLGSAGVLAAAALLIGSALGTYALIATRPAGRLGLALTLMAGWAGGLGLGWILWGFWTN